MAPPPAPLALLAVAGILMLSGIILAATANSKARAVAEDLQTTLAASRSRYVLSQVAATSQCAAGNDGCPSAPTVNVLGLVQKSDCQTFDLSSSVPTFASFNFYNITNGFEVNDAGATPVLKEEGPFTCVNAPPHAEARITRTSTTSADDLSATTMTYTETLECSHVMEGDAVVMLYDKNIGAVTPKTVSQWVDILKASILDGGNSEVGTGGAPAFGSFAAHGNTSNPNNYMRRVLDDVAVLPIWPHAYLPDDDFKLQPKITEDTTLQWYVSSFGRVVSFSWEYPLYMREPMFNRWQYARFVGYLPAAPIDLSSRGSSIFDKAYSYHKCVAPSGTFADVGESYPSCSAGVEEDLSPDDFFIDVNLFLGIPSPITDLDGASKLNGADKPWQAWEIPAFSGASSPNCTAFIGDSNIGMWLWSWDFWSGAVSPYPSHTSADPGYPTQDQDFKRDYPHELVVEIRNKNLDSGYNPYVYWGGGSQGSWRAEFGVTWNDATLPAFAFGMMPKMIPMISPEGAGGNFPFTIMGQITEVGMFAMKPFLSDVPTKSNLMEGWGSGVLYNVLFYAHGWYTLYLYTGIYSLVFSVCPTMLFGLYRLKSDAAAN